MAVAALKPKNAIESPRDVVQDLLVPELKAIKVELESVRVEIRLRDDNQTRAVAGLAEEMRLRDQKQTQALESASARQTQALESASAKQTQAIQSLSDKLGIAMEVRDRLAVLEDRAKHA